MIFWMDLDTKRLVNCATCLTRARLKILSFLKQRIQFTSLTVFFNTDENYHAIINCIL